MGVLNLEVQHPPPTTHTPPPTFHATFIKQMVILANMVGYIQM